MRSRDIWRLRLETETACFILLNLCDVVATFLLLRRSDSDLRFVESNPIARWFFEGWGFEGLIWFKVGMMATVVVISQVVAVKHSGTAKRLLDFGCIVLVCVFLYSAWLGTRTG
jgi:uncharacterized protein DUF5658